MSREMAPKLSGGIRSAERPWERCLDETFTKGTAAKLETPRLITLWVLNRQEISEPLLTAPAWLKIKAHR